MTDFIDGGMSKSRIRERLPNHLEQLTDDDGDLPDVEVQHTQSNETRAHDQGREVRSKQCLLKSPTGREVMTEVIRNHTLAFATSAKPLRAAQKNLWSRKQTKQQRS